MCDFTTDKIMDKIEDEITENSNWWFIRLTTDFTTKEKIAEFLKTIGGDNYIISKEYSRRSKLHYHIVTNVTHSKDDLKVLFYKEFEYEGMVKGVTTLKIDLMGKTRQDLLTCSKYSVKDGDYIYSSYFNQDIDMIVTSSYAKPDNITSKVQEAIETHLEASYLPHQHLDTTNLWIDIAKAKASHQLEIYPNKITAKVLGVYFFRYPEKIQEEAFKELKRFSWSRLQT